MADNESPTPPRLYDFFAEYDPLVLNPVECYWRDLQPWLEQNGYLLRPRYSPGWVPSWIGTTKKWFECEDGFCVGSRGIDAVRIKDGAIVCLKKARIAEDSKEVEIGRFFSSEALTKDARNHCVPIYDALQVPHDDGITIIVMPLLRSYDEPSLQTIGEAVDFFGQLFEGLQYMHEHHVAHRDCHSLNIMVDPRPLYPVMYHFASDDMKYDFSGRVKHLTRTARPVRYYLIDFGISRMYDPSGPPPLESLFIAGDKSIPEFRPEYFGIPYDPFPTDVYYSGNVIRGDFLMKYRGLSFMQPLISDMVQDDPKKRPTMDVVVSRFADIRAGLSSSKLRTRLVLYDEDPIMKIYKSVRHVFRTVGYIVRRIPAIPTPS